MLRIKLKISAACTHQCIKRVSGKNFVGSVRRLKDRKLIEPGIGSLCDRQVRIISAPVFGNRHSLRQVDLGNNIIDPSGLNTCDIIKNPEGSGPAALIFTCSADHDLGSPGLYIIGIRQCVVGALNQFLPIYFQSYVRRDGFSGIALRARQFDLRSGSGNLDEALHRIPDLRSLVGNLSDFKSCVQFRRCPGHIERLAGSAADDPVSVTGGHELPLLSGRGIQRALYYRSTVIFLVGLYLKILSGMEIPDLIVIAC